MKQRTLTALALLGVVLGVLFFEPTGVGKVIFVLLACVAVCWELSKLVDVLSVMVAIAGPVSVIWNRTFPVGFGIFSVAVGATGIIYLGSRSKFLKGIFSFIFAYGACLELMRLTTMQSSFPAVLLAAMPIWAGDTAAIYAGKAFGKHKLAPFISPNKTWEGSIANLLAAVITALALGYFLKYPMEKMALLGVSCGILGQAGDLFESYLKRQAGVKDSGNLLPGHGGVFDRLDSLLMTAPFSYWILSTFLK